ncbi:hypothetical protein TRL7639_03627 [Falsiruegeria litorea R37]|uniref:Tat pathway signal sequence domain protein n=1 Tax=Falsiruegeria litorea R37 TaxID=1200284 RepID=A0A1Y5TIF6_9RHOB|nr:hypothetical protein [Falsiruegeria litorea]SLN64710.1 hypothetical protein TRL7639_03627 [Falsiruegeria litorea R37]
MKRAAKVGLALSAISLTLSGAVSVYAEQIADLVLELNTVEDVGSACRLSFVAKNTTGQQIEKAVFETVIFDSTGSVVSLKLFDFRDLPMDRPRVRQFDLTDMACGDLGQALINGTSSCVVGGVESTLCQSSLSLKSRIGVELLG